tara:strand:+ start:69055 stop:69750 length:696 start_codon:yes stop_codon:yes gene_type:complete
MTNNKLFDKEFKYSHKNPYHEKLDEYSEFVMRDNESEDFHDKWNEEVFKREGPLCVEVGTGFGHFMHEYCEKNPEVNFVGIDYRFKRSYNLARKLSKHPTKNFKYLRARGERIEFIFGKSEVDRIFYFFPDPWPKKRHNKKRLFQAPFLEAAFKVLKPGGILYVKTDHDAYAEWMAERIDKNKLFDCELKTFNLREEFPDHFLSGFETKFEKIFIKKNIPIKAFVLKSKKQ